jgi:plastocyanin
MLKNCGLVLTAVLLFACLSCTPGPGNGNGNANGNANVTPTVSTASPTIAPASPSPVVTASPSPTAATTASVKATNFNWTDDVSGTPITTIKVGGSITWTISQGTHRLERVPGNATNGCDSLDASFNSGNLGSGQTVTRTFTKVGTFGYKCGIHQGVPNCKTPPGTTGDGTMPGVIKVVP